MHVSLFLLVQFRRENVLIGHRKYELREASKRNFSSYWYINIHNEFVVVWSVGKKASAVQSAGWYNKATPCCRGRVKDEM